MPWRLVKEEHHEKIIYILTGLMEPIGMRKRMKTGLRVIHRNNEEKN